jgi:hypothetical protein
MSAYAVEYVGEGVFGDAGSDSGDCDAGGDALGGFEADRADVGDELIILVGFGGKLMAGCGGFGRLLIT